MRCEVCIEFSASAKADVGRRIQGARTAFPSHPFGGRAMARSGPEPARPRPSGATSASRKVPGRRSYAMLRRLDSPRWAPSVAFLVLPTSSGRTLGLSSLGTIHERIRYGRMAVVGQCGTMGREAGKVASDALPSPQRQSSSIRRQIFEAEQRYLVRCGNFNLVASSPCQPFMIALCLWCMLLANLLLSNDLLGPDPKEYRMAGC